MKYFKEDTNKVQDTIFVEYHLCYYRYLLMNQIYIIIVCKLLLPYMS